MLYIQDLYVNLALQNSQLEYMCTLEIYMILCSYKIINFPYVYIHTQSICDFLTKSKILYICVLKYDVLITYVYA